jgi:hypothetical protein
VPRLPVAPRADGDGGHGQIRTATGQVLDLSPLPAWATWPLVPLGGFEPPPLGLRARHAALTLQRGWSRHGGSNPDLGRTRAACFRCHHGDVERVAGFEPVVIGLEARGPTVGRHSLGSAYGYRTRPSTLATWNATSTLRPNMDRCRSPTHRHPSVVKDPALTSHAAHVVSRLDHFEDRTSPRPDAGPSAVCQAKTKKAF